MTGFALLLREYCVNTIYLINKHSDKQTILYNYYVYLSEMNTKIFFVWGLIVSQLTRIIYLIHQ